MDVDGAPSGLNAGGFGRCAVLKPVVSVLYGPDGGAFTTSPTVLSAAEAREGADIGDCPEESTRLGGGANEDGSFSEDSGVDSCWRAAAECGSFGPLPTHPFYGDSVLQVLAAQA